jgi:hypothetical protein
VDWLAEANVSEKRTVSIFRADSDSRYGHFNPEDETVRFSETFASISQSTRRPNPEEHHQYRHRHENLKSQQNFGTELCIHFLN